MTGPAIAAAAAKLKARSFTLDGEAVVAGADGVTVFDALRRRGRVTDAILQAFDLLELDGVDYRPLPPGKRKEAAGSSAGGDPAQLARRDRIEAAGRAIPVRPWIKVKNPDQERHRGGQGHLAQPAAIPTK
jgi:ATP-dependent DNA ligase